MGSKEGQMSEVSQGKQMGECSEGQQQTWARIHFKIKMTSRYQVIIGKGSQRVGAGRQAQSGVQAAGISTSAASASS